MPGPRANLELVNVVADEGTEAQFKYFLTFDERKNPAQLTAGFFGRMWRRRHGTTPHARLPEALKILRAAASDSRWRVREGVAMALQRFGDTDMEGILAEMERWSRGSFLEMRAAAASLCEPRLLKQAEHAKEVLIILDRITKSISSAKDRNTDGFKALRKSMGYCWSVAVAANPDIGRPMLEQWFSTKDKDIRWIMRENLKKKRLQRIDAGWVQDCRVRLEQKEE